jgi:hypothetical protein
MPWPQRGKVSVPATDGACGRASACGHQRSPRRRRFLRACGRRFASDPLRFFDVIADAALCPELAPKLESTPQRNAVCQSVFPRLLFGSPCGVGGRQAPLVVSLKVVIPPGVPLNLTPLLVGAVSSIFEIFDGELGVVLADDRVRGESGQRQQRSRSREYREEKATPLFP